MFMKKAITPVISVILLIMLVVAITGGAWYWMTNVQGTLQEATGGGLEDIANIGSNNFQLISIKCWAPWGADNFDNITISIVNVGSSLIPDTTTWTATVSTIAGTTLGTQTDLGDAVGDIPAGGAATFNTTGVFWELVQNSTYTIKVTAGSYSQTKTCTVS